jgi:hypothetical protein
LASWRLDVPVDLGLDLDPGLGIPLLPDAARHGAVWECGHCRRFALRGNQLEKKNSGLSPSLCVVATSRRPNRDRLTAVIPALVLWPNDLRLSYRA